jgi:hypothetical protein
VKVLWHCEDRAGEAMAGPAIRAATLAARLAAKHEVTLLCPGASALPEALRAARGPGCDGRSLEVREFAPGGSLAAQLAGVDVLITQGFGFAPGDLARLPEGLRLVLDLYDPVLLELLARAGSQPAAGERLHLAAVRLRLLWMLGRADHVLCASDLQRAFWLGWLGAAGRLLPALFEEDPEAARLLAQVPFGIEPGEVVPGPAGEQGAGLLRAAAGEGEAPLLWWGGLWEWMDPVCAIRAVARLRAQGLRAALVLPAGNRPGAAPMPAAERAEAEARKLGLWEKGVGRLPAWVPYAERGPLLRAAAAAVSCHRPSLESLLSFRTRLLDCVWSGLPVACSAGDALSARGEREGWALTAPPGDDAALAAALAKLLAPGAREAASAAAARAAPAYGWDRSAATLLSLLDGPPAPRPAAGPLPELHGAGAGALFKSAAEKVLRALRAR